MRALILIHRYLGIVVGFLVIGWCLTGAVMMYVRYPQLTSSERLSHLGPLRLQSCCQLDASTLTSTSPIEGFDLESLADRPVATLRFADYTRRLIDLGTGAQISGVSAEQAARSTRAALGRTPRLLDLIDYDQWTVAGDFNRARPLYRFALDDVDGTQVYVSSLTGRMVQITTRQQRFWNWVGAVPHWLYFAQLRHQPRVWNQVMIWTSLAGCFLTLFGLYIGVRQFLRRPAGRWSGYRGVLYWHHVPGIVFGVFALTWVASGLISMNPWGFLEEEASLPDAATFEAAALSPDQLLQALNALKAARLAPIVAVESAPLEGHQFLLVTHTDGSRERLDLLGQPRALGAEDWARISHSVGATAPGAERLPGGDSYYYSRAGVTAPFPVYRILLDNAARSRLYLDPLTAKPLAVIDADGRWYRWLHLGLHTFDFDAAIRARPLWDVLMLVLLAGVTLVSATGTWLGWRRYLGRTRR